MRGALTTVDRFRSLAHWMQSWCQVFSCTVLLGTASVAFGGSGATSGTAEEKGDTGNTVNQPPPPQWWLSTEKVQIEGYSDGSRVIRRDTDREVENADRPATLTMADGSQFQATPEGRVIPFEPGTAWKNPSSQSMARSATSPSGTSMAVHRSATASRERVSSVKPASDHADDSRPWARWGGLTLTMALRVFCVVLFLRLVFSWIEVSYSYASVTRFALVFVVIGEAVFRTWSGSLWAG